MSESTLGQPTPASQVESRESVAAMIERMRQDALRTRHSVEKVRERAAKLAAQAGKPAPTAKPATAGPLATETVIGMDAVPLGLMVAVDAVSAAAPKPKQEDTAAQRAAKLARDGIMLIISYTDIDPKEVVRESYLNETEVSHRLKELVECRRPGTVRKVYYERNPRSKEDAAAGLPYTYAATYKGEWPLNTAFSKSGAEGRLERLAERLANAVTGQPDTTTAPANPDAEAAAKLVVDAVKAETNGAAK